LKKIDLKLAFLILFNIVELHKDMGKDFPKLWQDCFLFVISTKVLIVFIKLLQFELIINISQVLQLELFSLLFRKLLRDKAS